MIKSIKLANAHSIKEVGLVGKDLSNLYNLKFNTDFGIILTSEFFNELINDNSIVNKLNSLLIESEKANNDEIKDISEKLIFAINNCEFSEKLKEEIMDAYETLSWDTNVSASDLLKEKKYRINLIASVDYITRPLILQNISKNNIEESLKKIFSFFVSYEELKYRLNSNIDNKFNISIIMKKENNITATAFATLINQNENLIRVYVFPGCINFEELINSNQEIKPDVYTVDNDLLKIKSNIAGKQKFKTECNNGDYSRKECQINTFIINDVAVSEIARLIKKSGALLEKKVQGIFEITNNKILLTHISNILDLQKDYFFKIHKNKDNNCKDNNLENNSNIIIDSEEILNENQKQIFENQEIKQNTEETINTEQQETEIEQEEQNNTEQQETQENKIEQEKLKSQLNPETETIIESNEESNQTNNQEQIKSSLEQSEIQENKIEQEIQNNYENNTEQQETEININEMEIQTNTETTNTEKENIETNKEKTTKEEEINKEKTFDFKELINSDKTLGEIMSNPEDNSEEHLNEEEIQKTKELNNNQEQIETQNNSEIQNNIETTNIKQENNIESEKIEAQLNPETETIIEINEESNQTNNQEQIEPSLEQQETETQQQEIKQTNSEEITIKEDEPIDLIQEYKEESTQTNNQEQIEPSLEQQEEEQNNYENNTEQQQTEININEMEIQTNTETTNTEQENIETNKEKTTQQEEEQNSTEQQETETQQQEIKQTNSEEIEKQEKDNDFII